MQRNVSRHAPQLFRGTGALFVLLPALCFWLSAVRADEMTNEQKWTAPAAQARKRNPTSTTEASLNAGRKIYMKRCAACHGKTGNGDGHDAVDLGIHPAKFSSPKLREESDGALYWKITVGKKPMPDYGDRLSHTDRWNVINFLRTLAPK